MGISGTSGVLKERGTSGMVLRTTSTAAQTSVKGNQRADACHLSGEPCGYKSCQRPQVP